MLKQGSGLQRALADLEMLEPPSPELAAKFKIVSERTTLFRIAANAMINVSPNVIISVKLNPRTILSFLPWVYLASFPMPIVSG